MSKAKAVASVFLTLMAKIHNVYSHVIGYAISIGVFIATFFGDRIILWYYIMGCLAFDLFWGIWSASKLGNFTLSLCLSKTAMKLAIYFSLFTMVYLAETAFVGNMQIATRAFCMILCSAEIWSTLGHILIVHPDTPIVKLLGKYLIGEISKKTGIPISKLKKQLGDIGV